MIFRNRLFLRWFKWQILLWSSMMFFFGAFFYYTSQSLGDQIQRLYEEKMLRMTEDVNKVMSEALSEGIQCVINPELQVISTTRTESEKSLDREYARLVDEIKQSNASNQSVSEVILYFSEMIPRI